MWKREKKGTTYDLTCVEEEKNGVYVEDRLDKKKQLGRVEPMMIY